MESSSKKHDEELLKHRSFGNKGKKERSEAEMRDAPKHKPYRRTNERWEELEDE